MFEGLLSDRSVERFYVRAGADFGDAVSLIFIGECIGFEGLLNRWAKWEREYARRGYRTLPVDDFTNYGGYGIPLNGFGERVGEGEVPVLHAEVYRKLYLGKIPPAVNTGELLSVDGVDTQVGTYYLPSTREIEK